VSRKVQSEASVGVRWTRKFGQSVKLGWTERLRRVFR
jgi:hypothetical protein